MYMVLKQADIFGGYRLIVNKDNKKPPPPKKTANSILKQKIKLLYRMYESLYRKQNISILEPREVIIKNGIISYPEERQAEPIELIDLTLEDIDKRIDIMKEYLKC